MSKCTDFFQRGEDDGDQLHFSGGRPDGAVPRLQLPLGSRAGLLVHIQTRTETLITYLISADMNYGMEIEDMFKSGLTILYK